MCITGLAGRVHYIRVFDGMMYMLLGTHVPEHGPQARPHRETRPSPAKHLKFVALSTELCRVSQWKQHSAWGNSQGARATYRDLNPGGTRVEQRYARRSWLFLIAGSAL